MATILADWLGTCYTKVEDSSEVIFNVHATEGVDVTFDGVDCLEKPSLLNLQGASDSSDRFGKEFWQFLDAKLGDLMAVHSATSTEMSKAGTYHGIQELRIFDPVAACKSLGAPDESVIFLAPAALAAVHEAQRRLRAGAADGAACEGAGLDVVAADGTLRVAGCFLAHIYIHIA